jgi:hypothetical protein
VRRVAILVGLAGCGPWTTGAATYRFAVGWQGSLPSWNGPCDVTTLKPTGILEEPAPGSFVARRAGTAEVRCRDGTLRLVVRTPDRIVIEPIGPLRLHGTHILSAGVADAEGTLDLGDAAIEWALPPQLRETDRCNHMSGTCLSGGRVRVVADLPGDAQVTVRYGPLSQKATFHIE